MGINSVQRSAFSGWIVSNLLPVIFLMLFISNLSYGDVGLMVNSIDPASGSLNIDPNDGITIGINDDECDYNSSYDLVLNIEGGIFEGGITGSNVLGDTGGRTDGGNNINSNPAFLNGDDGDDYDYDNITEALLKGSSTSNWMTSDDGLMITTLSPCKGTGNDDYVDGTVYTVETDIVGNDRQNATVDIGAYEYYSSN